MENQLRGEILIFVASQVLCASVSDLRSPKADSLLTGRGASSRHRGGHRAMARPATKETPPKRKNQSRRRDERLPRRRSPPETGEMARRGGARRDLSGGKCARASGRNRLGDAAPCLSSPVLLFSLSRLDLGRGGGGRAAQRRGAGPEGRMVLDGSGI